LKELERPTLPEVKRFVIEKGLTDYVKKMYEEHVRYHHCGRTNFLTSKCPQFNAILIYYVWANME